MKDFLEDFRDNWNNSYWWADHQWLMAIILGTTVGAISVTTKYLELKMEESIMRTGERE